MRRCLALAPEKKFRKGRAQLRGRDGALADQADQKESVAENLARLLREAQAEKHRQRYLPAIANFAAAEQLILAQIPSPNRPVITGPEGPSGSELAALARHIMDAGAIAAQQAGPAALVFLGLQVGGERPEVKRAGVRIEIRQDAAESEVETRPPYSRLEIAEKIDRYLNEAPADDEVAEAGPLSTRTDPSQVPAEFGKYYFGDIPIGIGECLVLLEQQFDRALAYYERARKYPYTNPPFQTIDLWLRMAEAWLAKGDALYRAGDVAAARQAYELVLKNGAPAAGSPLYQGSLAIMTAKTQLWLRRMEENPASISAAEVPPNHVHILARIKQRISQLDAGLDVLGHAPNWVPVFSFNYLREIARSFAQFAAQANREYVAYTQRAEDQTQTVQQMEQAVVLGEASLEVDAAHVGEVQAEIIAAMQAQSLAARRVELARANAATFSDLGWDRVRLDELAAWSSAASVGDGNEVRQIIGNHWEEYGLRGTYDRSDLLQAIARRREALGYRIELGRLNNAVVELNAATQTAQAQTNLARARLPAAQAALTAARWRNRFARENLQAARDRETSPELFFELARWARDTARIYLDRSISIAVAMERAYNFENNTQLRRIRTDYGDLAGVGNLYAADLLLRDIDSFLVETLTRTTAKSQLAVQYISLRREFPLQFAEFLRTGTMTFQTILSQFHAAAPGSFNGRIKRVAIDFAGISSTRGVSANLTCGGVSAVRNIDGTSSQKVHPSETMLVSPLSPDRSLAKLDSGTLAMPTGEIGVFENVGLQCSWRLDVPQRANDMQLSTAADVGMVVAYLWQHDPKLEADDLARPPGPGNAHLWFSLRDQARDEEDTPAFAALAKTGSAPFLFRESWLPRYVRNARITDVSLFCVRRSSTPLPLTARMWVDGYGDQTRQYLPDANGITAVERKAAPGFLHDLSPARRWYLAIDPDRNPELRADASDQILNLDGIHDIVMTIAYDHDYR